MRAQVVALFEEFHLSRLQIPLICNEVSGSSKEVDRQVLGLMHSFFSRILTHLPYIMNLIIWSELCASLKAVCDHKGTIESITALHSQHHFFPHIPVFEISTVITFLSSY